MRKPVTTLLAVTIPCVLALSACGEKTRLVSLPADLTTCADEPLAPQLPAWDWSSVEAAQHVATIRDALTFEYVLQMRSFGGDCKAKVVGAAAWNERVKR